MLYAIYELGNNKYQIVQSDQDNKIRKKTIEYKPCLYVADEKGKYTDFYGKKLKKVIFEDEYEYKSAIKDYQKNGTFYCGDIQPKYQCLAHNIDVINFDITPVISYNFDIECFSLEDDGFPDPELAEKPIQSITIQNMFTNKYLVFGYEEYEITDINRYDDKGNILFTVSKEDIKYIKCGNERILIKKFINVLTENVNAICGYNTIFFDNKYIINRCKRLNIEKEFVNEAHVRNDDFEFGFMQNIDSFTSIKKFKNDTLENNQLNTVAKAYLGYGKIEFKGSFRDLYLSDFKKFIDYNIIDVALVYMLEQKLGIIKLMFNMANRFFCNPTDTMSLTQYVDVAIYKKCLENNIIVPAKVKKTKEPYVGGFVMEPSRGLNDYSICMDIESSYPTNSRRYNISPETLIEYKDLPDELIELVLDLKFKIAKSVYNEYKNYYRTKDGDIKVNTGKANKITHENCALHFIKDDNKKDIVLSKLAYPRFFIDYSEQDSNENIDTIRLDKKTQLLFVMNYNDLKPILKTRKFNTNFFAMYEMIITEKLIEYFVEDHNRFKTFKTLLKQYNYTMTCNLQFFKIGKLGILAQFQEDNYIDRVKFKVLEKDYGFLIDYLQNNDESSKNKIKNKQIIEDVKNIDTAKNLMQLAALNNNTYKIVINGSYGFQSTERSRYYNKHLGESITSSGQLSIRGVCKYLENKHIISSLYGDTDARVFHPNRDSELYKKILDNKENKHYICELLLNWFRNDVLPHINDYFNILKDLCNTRDVDIKFDLETIQQTTLFTDKKKYSWLLLYKDGIVFEKEKFKHKGLNFVKSDTPPWCRPKLKKFTELTITTKDPKLLKAYIMKCEEVYTKQSLASISKPVSVKTLDKYTSEDNAIPAGVDAALNYNLFIQDQKLKQYSTITAGSKIKWIYINPSNCYGFDKIAIMEEGALKEVQEFFEIDYKKQFQTTFLSLPERIFEVCGWKLYGKKELF